MHIRVVFPALLWLAAMILVISAPVNEFSEPFVLGISSRAVLHGFLFAGFSLSLLSAFYKQLKYSNLKRNAVPITLGVGTFIGTFSEVIAIGLHHHHDFNFWNVVMNIIGTILGIVAFKIVYKECC